MLIEPPAFWALRAAGPLDAEAERTAATLRTLHGDISEDQLEQFLRVAGLLPPGQSAHLHPRRAASRYLLSGLARCGHCGKARVGQEAKGGKFSYYVCGSLLKQGAGACPAFYLNSQKFERLVVDKIRERILTEENLRELVRLVNEEMDALAGESRQRLEAVTAELDDVHRRLERLYDVLETGKLTLGDLAHRPGATPARGPVASRAP